MNFSYFQKRSQDKQDPTEENIPVSSDLHTNIDALKKEFGDCADLFIRELNLGTQVDIAIVHIDSISDAKTINSSIVQPLLTLGANKQFDNSTNTSDILYMLKNHTLAVCVLKATNNWNEVISAIVSGDTVILLQHSKEALIANSSHIESRSVEESTTQVLIRGPKDSFTEAIRTNISLVRTRIRNSKLRVDSIKLGEVTQTDVAIMYIEGIIKPSTLKDLRKRLQRIKIDSILESGYIESFIQDSKFSMFPTILNTERPDVVAANLLEGRFAIFVNGTPFVLIAPATFMQFFQTPEDYYQRYDIGSFLRLLRIAAFFVSLLVPALYVAAATHHQGMIPTVLVLSIASQREGVPLPVIVEVIFMELAFEFLREAGIRMPRAVGQTASIVGALILGQAAVQAGFVSAATIIIVSITAISSFAIPNYNLAITARLLRFVLMIMAAYIGLYGILLIMLALGLHLCKLNSFGIPYLTPLAPFIAEEQKDTFFRFPLHFMFKRPITAKETSKQRLSTRDGDTDAT
ncbi:spore germination protein [Bacillus rhizoplanae]|uniref:spore germination protein n=1 Tax=Bacillus rhizoplanae TaxID=2880966 RepID=UPI003D210AD5